MEVLGYLQQAIGAVMIIVSFFAPDAETNYRIFTSGMLMFISGQITVKNNS